MNEVAAQFGADRHLTGIVSLPEPPSPESRKETVGVILPNAGVIHRVGPHRFTVKLARALAKRGFPVLRFDLSGLGDSRAPAEALNYADQAVADLGSGMGYLASATGAKSFILAGICSGAHNAFNAARADPRVVAVWSMDQFQFPTRWTKLHFARKKLAHESLRDLLSRRVRNLPDRIRKVFGGAGGPADAEDEKAEFDLPYEAEDFAEGLNELGRRGVKMDFVYSGSVLDEYSYQRQFHDRFAKSARLDHVDVALLPTIDHTLTTVESQAVLLDRLQRFCEGVRRRL